MRKIYTLILVIFLFLVSAQVNAVSAQTFKFELANPGQTIAVGSNFDVKILINTSGQETINGDALIIYDPAKVGIVSAQIGNFFTYFSANPLGGSSNKYLVSNWEETFAYAKSSTTDTLFATLTLTARGGGSTGLSFDCTPGTGADSNISRASDSTDIINCSSLTALTFNIGGASVTTPPGQPTPTTPPGGVPTATPTGSGVIPTPTRTPTITPTRTPTRTRTPTATKKPQVTQLPRAGSVEATAIAVGAGTLLTILGILIIL